MQLGHGEAPHKPRAKLRKAATGGRGPQAEGGAAAKGGGASASPKEGGLFYSPLSPFGWGLLRAPLGACDQ